ncbi:MAG: hypothetical protein E3J72_04135 [Planctomycetota bacterium]|nr:MAG: hypothetical protein E3J72_04135 [Planctomycetota bacterium]
MLQARVVLALFAVSVLVSGCSYLGFKRIPKLTGNTEVTILKVITPSEYLVSTDKGERKVHLLGVEGMKVGHPEFESAMKALSVRTGTSVVLRYVGKSFWKKGQLNVLLFFNRPHKILSETGSETETENVLLNEEVLKMGYGRFVEGKTKMPEGFKEQLQAAENEARDGGFGIWEKAYIE